MQRLFVPVSHSPPLPACTRVSRQVSICQACGLTGINRLERSRRYLVWTKAPLTDEQAQAFLGTCCVALGCCKMDVWQVLCTAD